MDKLVICLYRPGESAPEIRVVLPVSTLSLSMELLPQSLKEVLDKEGYDLVSLAAGLG